MLAGWMADEHGRNFLMARTRSRSLKLEDVVDDPSSLVGIVTLPDGLPIGATAFLNIDVDQRMAELRKLIGEPSMRARGYAKAASRLWVGHGFRGLGLHKIYLNTLNTNLRNIQLNEDLGFRVEGILRDEVLLAGTYYDVLRMAIWEGREAREASAAARSRIQSTSAGWRRRIPARFWGIRSIEKVTLVRLVGQADHVLHALAPAPQLGHDADGRRLLPARADHHQRRVDLDRPVHVAGILRDPRAHDVLGEHSTVVAPPATPRRLVHDHHDHEEDDTSTGSADTAARVGSVGMEVTRCQRAPPLGSSVCCAVHALSCRMRGNEVLPGHPVDEGLGDIRVELGARPFPDGAQAGVGARRPAVRAG